MAARAPREQRRCLVRRLHAPLALPSALTPLPPPVRAPLPPSRSLPALPRAAALIAYALSPATEHDAPGSAGSVVVGREGVAHSLSPPPFPVGLALPLSLSPTRFTLPVPPRPSLVCILSLFINLSPLPPSINPGRTLMPPKSTASVLSGTCTCTSAGQTN